MLVCPSTLAHIVNGVLILVAVIMIFVYWQNLRRARPEMLIILTLILATTVGVHGISHRWLEKNMKMACL